MQEVRNLIPQDGHGPREEVGQDPLGELLTEGSHVPPPTEPSSPLSPDALTLGFSTLVRAASCCGVVAFSIFAVALGT